MIAMEGIHQMTSEAYHADPAPAPSLSASIGKILLAQSPRHAWCAHPLLNPDYKSIESARFDLGTAAHDLILEGGTAKICVINPEDYRSKPTKANPEGSVPAGWTNTAIREARDTARLNGLVPILPWDNKAIQDMVGEAQAFLRHTELADVFRNGKPEQTVIARDENVYLRSRLDWLTDDRRTILDYKTAACAEPGHFTRRVMCQMGYDFQASFYQRIVELVTGVRPKFYFLSQEIEPPYLCSIIACDPMLADLASRDVNRAMTLWHKCITTDDWPGYSTQVHYAEAPNWKVADATEREEMEQ